MDYCGIYNIPMYNEFYFLVPRQMVRRLSTPILKAVPVSDMFAINESSVNIIAINTVYFYWQICYLHFDIANTYILKQNQNDPFLVEDQVAIIYAGSQNLLKEVPVEKVKAFEEAFLQELRKNNKKLLAELKSGKISDKETNEIKKVAAKIAKTF